MRPRASRRSAQNAGPEAGVSHWVSCRLMRTLRAVALDLFGIDDGVALQDDPAGRRLIGQLELAEHDALRRQWRSGDLDLWLPYFDDRRLLNSDVAHLRQALAPAAASTQPGSGVRRLVEILDTAL